MGCEGRLGLRRGTPGLNHNPRPLTRATVFPFGSVAVAVRKLPSARPANVV